VFVTEIPSIEIVIAEGLDVRQQVGVWRKARTVTFDVPLRPGAILATGSNYRDHVDERIPASGGTNAPPRDMEFFIKHGLTISSPNAPLKLHPSIGQKIDQETEIALVLGPGCTRGMSEDEACSRVYGFVVANDLTARDKQVRLLPDGSNFMVLGASKNFEGSTRLGRHIVTADEVPDWDDLGLRTFINGEMKQNNSTANLINSFGAIVSHFSNVLTLAPGTMILTGTPGGTGWGQDRELGGTGYVPPLCTPSAYLRAGDEVRSVVDGIGELTFTVEPGASK